MAVTSAACANCGILVAGSDILYDETARIVCARCAGNAEIVRDEGRAARNLRMAGWSALGCGAVAFFGPIAMLGVITYLFVAMSLAAAIFAIQGMAVGNERFTKYLTASQRATLWITSIIGIVLSALGVFGVASLFR
jgi:hypothetical protein